MKLLYRIYQSVFLTIFGGLATLLTAGVTIVGCIFNGHFWGYYPGKLWARFMCFISLIPVKVTGRENIRKGQSYVFVLNHQGAYDIFLVYGYLNRNFKWMMKKSLRKAPVIGPACAACHHIFVDNSSPSAIVRTIEEGRKTLQGGTSLVVFPEGQRTFTGRMNRFKKGAFLLAEQLGLPIVPITINGSFEILPRQKGMSFINWHRMSMTIHKPIQPKGDSPEAIREVMEEAYESIHSDLEERYK